MRRVAFHEDGNLLSDDGSMWTVCDVCNELRCEIVDGVAPRFCPPCVKAGWR